MDGLGYEESERYLLCVIAIDDLEIHPAFLEFLHGDASRFVLAGIDVRTRNGTALELLAALSCKNDHSIF